jgi:hypothetical protein
MPCNGTKINHLLHIVDAEAKALLLLHMQVLTGTHAADQG